jgi:transcriptional regulator of acetoin/glycerol metabolism
VRELENVLRRAVATAGPRGIIHLGDLDKNLRRGASLVQSGNGDRVDGEAGVASTGELLSCSDQTTDEGGRKRFYFPRDVEESVKQKMLDALKEAGGNKAKAARSLGMRYTTFVNRINRFRLDLCNGGK